MIKVLKKNPFGIIFLYFTVEMFLSLIYNYIPIKNKIIDNLVLSLINIIILLFVMYLLKNKLKGQLQDFKQNFRNYILKILKYWSLGLLGMFIVNFIINFIIFKGTGLAPNESANREILYNYPLYSVISMCIISPAIEELLFRLNFDGIKNKYLFLFTTSILFGLMHMMASTTLLDLIYIVPYVVLGYAFGLVFYNTKNIYSSILAHMLHNTLSIIIILLGI